MSLAAGVHRPFGGSPSLVYVPRPLPPCPAPLVVLLHGAGGHPDQALTYLRQQADDDGLLLLVPTSAGRTWDAIRGSFGPDLTTLERSMAYALERLPVDPDRLAIAGFSDGATYALSVGLAQGLLFHHVLAFSPGFVIPAPRVGRPAIFISHGTADPVLPIDRCSRRIVPALRADGYPVRYHEFVGGHSVPASIATAAVATLAR